MSYFYLTHEFGTSAIFLSFAFICPVRVLIIFCKVTVIILMLNKRINELAIWATLYQNVMVIFVRTSTHFFIESVGKIEIVQEFKITVFEEMFYCCLQPHTTDFDKHDILHFAFWIYFPFIKTLSIEIISNCPFMMILLLKFITTPK